MFEKTFDETAKAGGWVFGIILYKMGGGIFNADIFLATLAQVPEVLNNPQVQIGLRPLRKVFENLVGAYDLDQRRVNPVIPMRNGFFPGDFAFMSFALEPGVYADMFNQFIITARQG